MLIKASRITNLTDARYFAAKEVEYLGFNLEEGTAGYLDPMYMKAIREWVEGPKIVGEFSRSPVAYIREAAGFFGLDAVQVPMSYAAYLADLGGLSVIMEVEAFDANEHLFQQSLPFVAYFLLKINNVDALASSTISRICANYPILLQTDAKSAQIFQWTETLKPAGLSLVGGEEEQIGIKSFDEIEEIFEGLGR